MYEFLNSLSIIICFNPLVNPSVEFSVKIPNSPKLRSSLGPVRFTETTGLFKTIASAITKENASE